MSDNVVARYPRAGNSSVAAVRIRASVWVRCALRRVDGGGLTGSDRRRGGWEVNYAPWSAYPAPSPRSRAAGLAQRLRDHDYDEFMAEEFATLRSAQQDLAEAGVPASGTDPFGMYVHR